MTSSTSRSLLDGLRSRHDTAWQRLARLYGPLVYRWCVGSGLQHHDAADLTQEVFRAVWLNISSFRKERDGDTFRGWLRTITRNKVIDFARKQQRLPDAIGGSTVQQKMLLVEAEQDGSSNEGLFEDHGLYSRALECVRAEFEDRTWQAFRLVTIDQRYPADVAQQLGMTINAVYKAKARVLKRLREELGDVPSVREPL